MWWGGGRGELAPKQHRFCVTMSYGGTRVLNVLRDAGFQPASCFWEGYIRYIQDTFKEEMWLGIPALPAQARGPASYL